MKTLAFLAAIVLSNPAFAWQTDIETDPLEDVAAALVWHTLPGTETSLAAKCWHNRSKGTVLYFQPGQAFDPAARYEPERMTLRTDGREPFTVTMYPVNLSGYLSYAAVAEHEAQLFVILAQIGAAEERVVVANPFQALVFPALGSTGAVKKFSETCNLRLPDITR